MRMSLATGWRHSYEYKALVREQLPFSALAAMDAHIHLYMWMWMSVSIFTPKILWQAIAPCCLFAPRFHLNWDYLEVGNHFAVRSIWLQKHTAVFSVCLRHTKMALMICDAILLFYTLYHNKNEPQTTKHLAPLQYIHIIFGSQFIWISLAYIWIVAFCSLFVINTRRYNIYTHPKLYHSIHGILVFSSDIGRRRRRQHEQQQKSGENCLTTSWIRYSNKWAWLFHIILDYDDYYRYYIHLTVCASIENMFHRSSVWLRFIASAFCLFIHRLMDDFQFDLIMVWLLSGNHNNNKPPQHMRVYERLRCHIDDLPWPTHSVQSFISSFICSIHELIGLAAGNSHQIPNQP